MNPLPPKRSRLAARRQARSTRRLRQVFTVIAAAVVGSGMLAAADFAVPVDTGTAAAASVAVADAAHRGAASRPSLRTTDVHVADSRSGWRTRWHRHAATPGTTSASPPTPTTTSPASPTPTTTTVPPPRVPAPALQGRDTPAAAGAFPTAATTGVAAGTTLVTHQGSLIVTRPNQIVDGIRVTGDVRIRAAGVVIRNSEILGRVFNQDGGPAGSFTIEDSTVGAAGTCAATGEGAIGSDHYSARRVEIQGYSDGFRVSGNDVLIQDSFVDLCDMTGAHSDGIQGYFGGTNVRLLHNTIDARVRPENENAAIFFSDDSRGAEVRDNLLVGGGYTLRLHDETAAKKPQDVATYTVSGNRIVDGGWGYGPVSVDDCLRGRAITWSDNRVVKIDAAFRVTSLGAAIAC